MAEEKNKELNGLLRQVAELVPTMLLVGMTADKRGVLLMGSPEKTDEQRKIDLTAAVAMMLDENGELRELLFAAICWFMENNPQYIDIMRDALDVMKSKRCGR